jgi:Protein of unknown function (DUF3168)
MALKDIRSALRRFLLADPAIAAIVGTNNRIYPVRLPQGQRLPSIVYSRVSGMGDHHMQGASGLSSPRFQIDAWAPTIDEAANLADLVQERIDGYRGPMPNTGSPADDVEVQGVFLDNERDDYQSDIDMNRVSRDYIVWYEER